MPLSEIINIDRFDDPEWMELHRALEAYSADKHVFFTSEGNVYRKGWEWTHCIYGLQKLSVVVPGARGLGVGSGREPVIFFLGERCREIVSTDLYGNDVWTGSSGAEAPSEILEDHQKFCPKPLQAANIRFQTADGTSLPFGDSEFDFCWSLSSIEHFGGHEAAKKAIQEMARVTRAGGIVCVATEYLLLAEQTHPEYFNRAEVEHFLINATDSLELVDGMSWDLPPVEYLIDQITVPGEGVHRRRRHVVLNDGWHQWTSFMLFLRKI